jgi:hypothetical protein
MSLDQHADAINKICSGKMNTCDFCGTADGVSWLHFDSWTRWLRIGCGCNISCCQNCREQVHDRRIEIIAANREEARKNEDKYLINPSEGDLCFIRCRYYHAFNCGEDFRDWVASVVGVEKMKEILNVPCQRCGAILGHSQAKPQVVQTNYRQLLEEEDQLKKRFKSDDDESEYSYMNKVDWKEAFWKLESRKEYGYFCSDICHKESKTNGCLIFV